MRAHPGGIALGLGRADHTGAQVHTHTRPGGSAAVKVGCRIAVIAGHPHARHTRQANTRQTDTGLVARVAGGAADVITPGDSLVNQLKALHH